MSQYVTYSLGADPVQVPTQELTSEQVYKLTAEEALSDASQRSTNIALGIKGLNAALKASTPDVDGNLQTLANEVDGLRVRMQTYLNSLSDQKILYNMTAGELFLTALVPLLAIKQVWEPNKITKNGHLMLLQMISFQKELQGYCNRFATLTGSSIGACQMFPAPRPRPPEPKVEDRFLDFLWGVLKVGAVGLGGWLLYQQLEKQTRYPEDRLPRYAGGRRASRRKQ